jgi:hypothetical protein
MLYTVKAIKWILGTEWSKVVCFVLFCFVLFCFVTEVKRRFCLFYEKDCCGRSIILIDGVLEVHFNGEKNAVVFG